MGIATGRSPKKDGPATTMRDYGVLVSWMWTQEVRRNLWELLRFRIMMLRLEREHPDAYRLANLIFRAVVMVEVGGYHGSKVNKPNNGSTTPNSPTDSPVKEGASMGDEEE